MDVRDAYLGVMNPYLFRQCEILVNSYICQPAKDVGLFTDYMIQHETMSVLPTSIQTYFYHLTEKCANFEDTKTILMSQLADDAFRMELTDTLMTYSSLRRAGSSGGDAVWVDVNDPHRARKQRPAPKRSSSMVQRIGNAFSTMRSKSVSRSGRRERGSSKRTSSVAAAPPPDV